MDTVRLRSHARVFSSQGTPQAFLYAFDVLELDGRDLRNELWARHRDALVQLLTDADAGIQLCAHIEDVDGAVVFRQACVMGLEGIVAKQREVATARDVPGNGSRSKTRHTRRSSARC